MILRQMVLELQDEMYAASTGQSPAATYWADRLGAILSATEPGEAQGGGMKVIEVAVIGGADGASLQVWGRDGGKRISGPKAWGNPHNKPIHKFTVIADELIEAIKQNAYEEAPDGSA